MYPQDNDADSKRKPAKKKDLYQSGDDITGEPFLKVEYTKCPDCGAAMERVSEKQPTINFVTVPDVAVLKCLKCGKRVAAW